MTQLYSQFNHVNTALQQVQHTTHISSNDLAQLIASCQGTDASLACLVRVTIPQIDEVLHEYKERQGVIVTQIEQLEDKLTVNCETTESHSKTLQTLTKNTTNIHKEVSIISDTLQDTVNLAQTNASSIDQFNESMINQRCSIRDIESRLKTQRVQQLSQHTTGTTSISSMQVQSILQDMIKSMENRDMKFATTTELQILCKSVMDKLLTLESRPKDTVAQSLEVQAIRKDLDSLISKITAI